jgi:hypothetical protein
LTTALNCRKLLRARLTPACRAFSNPKLGRLVPAAPLVKKMVGYVAARRLFGV